ncbi:MAG TPA: POTRA domain-containing protein [Bryobacteraceae bacterium]|nr:POTRA domain-containing protein [Bryobacteraceae bacterium]
MRITSRAAWFLNPALVCLCALSSTPLLQGQKPAPPQIQAPAVSGVIDGIELRGAHQIPQDILRTLIASKVGDLTSEETLRRDFAALWNTNRFDDIRLETARSDHGGVIVRFIVTERAVAAIGNAGAANSGQPVAAEEILRRFEAGKMV